MKNKKLLFISITALAIVFLDQLTKYIISTNMTLSQSIPLVKNILHITYIHNFGAGFGILQNQRVLLIAVSVVVIAAILYYSKQIPEKGATKFFVALILGGAIGNLINRIFQGYVVDFIDFRIWPAFNVADSAITIGAIGLVILLWKE